MSQWTGESGSSQYESARNTRNLPGSFTEDLPTPASSQQSTGYEHSQADPEAARRRYLEETYESAKSSSKDSAVGKVLRRWLPNSCLPPSTTYQKVRLSNISRSPKTGPDSSKGSGVCGKEEDGVESVDWATRTAHPPTTAHQSEEPQQTKDETPPRSSWWSSYVPSASTVAWSVAALGAAGTAYYLNQHTDGGVSSAISNASSWIQDRATPVLSSVASNGGKLFDWARTDGLDYAWTGLKMGGRGLKAGATATYSGVASATSMAWNIAAPTDVGFDDERGYGSDWIPSIFNYVT